MQPSVIGNTRHLHYEQVKACDVIYNDQYFVGGLALRHSRVKYAGTKESKADNWTTDVLLRTALGIVAPEEAVNLVTGLPVDFFFNQRPAFDRLLGEFNPTPFTLKVGHDLRKVNPDISRFKLVPQPLGAAMDYLLDDQGRVVLKEEARGRLLVIDIGYYTLDLLVLDSMEMGKDSCSPPGLGVGTAYSLLQESLKDNFGKAPARYALDSHVISGTYCGYDIREFTEAAFKALATQIQIEVESLNQVFDRILLVGGAAEIIYPFLQLSRLRVAPGAQLANVRGYRKIGTRLWG